MREKLLRMFALYWRCLQGSNIKWKEIWYDPGQNIHATMIYPFVPYAAVIKCRDVTEEQIHRTLGKNMRYSGADRMFVERASKILEP